MTDPLATADPATTLGEDLAALVAGRGVPLERVVEVTVLRPADRRRCAFRLDFADGTRLKGRRLDGADKARRAAALLGVVGAGFPRVIGRRGDALLLEWIEGPTLASLGRLPAATLRRCGASLGALHALDAAALTDEPAPSLDDLVGKLEGGAQQLLRAGVLSAGLARRALAAAEAHRPADPTFGIVHKDFCAENIVQDGAGRLVCIDNPSLSVGPHDLDLARTWHRWPMDADERAAFEAGYAERRGLDGFRGHLLFWATMVLLVAAARRHRMGAPGAAEAVARLERVLAGDPRRGLPGREARSP